MHLADSSEELKIDLNDGSHDAYTGKDYNDPRKNLVGSVDNLGKPKTDYRVDRDAPVYRSVPHPVILYALCVENAQVFHQELI